MELDDHEVFDMGFPASPMLLQNAEGEFGGPFWELCADILGQMPYETRQEFLRKLTDVIALMPVTPSSTASRN
jgi:hypothetical protein